MKLDNASRAIPSVKGQGLIKLHDGRFPSSRRDAETGTSAAEYGLLIALIAAILVLAFYALSSLVMNSFGETCSDISRGSGTTSERADCGSD